MVASFLGWSPWEFVGFIFMWLMIAFVAWVIINAIPFDWKEDLTSIGDKITK